MTKGFEERTSDIKASDNDQRYVPDMRLGCNCLSLDTMSQAADTEDNETLRTRMLAGPLHPAQYNTDLI